MAVKFARFVKVAGVFIYPLGMFATDLLLSEAAVEKAKDLGMFAPFVCLLDRPETS